MRKLSPEMVRRLRRVGTNVGAFLLVFVVALYIWFPYDRAKEVAISVASAQGYDVEIESAGPTFGVGVSFSNIRVKTRPTSGKATRFSIDKARLSTSIFGALFSTTLPYTITLDAFGGRVEISQSGTPGKKGPFRVEVTARDLQMSEIPGIRESVNLPVSGTLRLDLDLASATGKFANAKGTISFLCEACVAGDGKAPLRVEGNAFLGGGLTLPKVRLGDLRGEIVVDNGTAKLKSVESKSPDGEIALDGDVSLRDPLVNSVVNAYLRFKLSDAFLKSASTVQTILQMAAGPGRRPDGSYGLRVAGRLAAPAISLSASSPVGGPGPTVPVRPGRPGIVPSMPPPPPGAPPLALPPPPPPPQQEPPPPSPPQQQDMPPPPPQQIASPPPPDVQQAQNLRGTPPSPPAPVVDAPAAPGPDAAAPPPGEEAQ
jgi:type II secretion system protein N